MKNCFALPTIALLLSACSASKGSMEQTAVSNLPDLIPGTSIVYSANVDGELEPCGCRSNPTGGIHRRWNLIEQKIPGDKLSIDSGDLLYESMPVPPFLEKQWNVQAAALIQGYNALRIDALSPGELDFAAGLAQFEKLRSQAKFKFISANIYRKDAGKRLLDPYVIIEKGTKKIALFGIIDETLPLPPELEARDHVAAAKAMVQELRKKADVLIALTHIGLDKDHELAKQVQGLDAIFGAHTQSFLLSPDKVGETLIFQPSFRGQHIGAFWSGKHGLYQVDARFDSPADKKNPLDKLVEETKAEIGRLNKATESDLMAESKSDSNKPREFQTFARCAECHIPQYNFHKNTPHMRAYETLVKAKQNNNLACLKCHTVGPQQPGGWANVNKLVLNNAGKAVEPESFAKSLPKTKVEGLAKFSKTFMNVQCENCHGAAGEHPFSGSYPKEVSTTTCLQCHTREQAPSWYKNGTPDAAVVAAKLKSMACPRGN